VNFELDENEVALQKGIRELCRARFPLDDLRSIEGGMDRGIWRELGDAGVFSIRLPESDGGVGLGSAQAVLVFEELGAALIPGPLVAGYLAAGLVDGAATGERVVGVVEGDRSPLLVEHPDALDELLVIDDGGIRRVDPASLDGHLIERPLDPMTPLLFVERLPQGEEVDGPDTAARWRLEGAAMSAALLLGIALETTELATTYAKERVQFDRPIGSFQAVKHLLADMLVRAEVARAAVYAAGVLLDDPTAGDPGRAIAAAKLLASAAAVTNGKTCIQVHGGTGFTWEAAAHLYLKRASVLATTFGSSDEHADVMATYLVGSHR
jgi:alkylation response protein AidB-like acyl-CoA dehydrogenase